MRLDIDYVTRFLYSDPVWDSHNALRACPRNDDLQHRQSYEVTVSPDTSISHYIDRWGTRVDDFGIRRPHDELVVQARSVVETQPRPRPGLPTELAGLEDSAFLGAHWMYLQPSAHVRWDDEMADTAKTAVGEADSVEDAVDGLCGLVHDRMTYRSGATEIGVDASTLWLEREGVCQDYAHLAIALLRSARVPARYVSGYFYAADPSAGDSPDGEEITVQTHAWIEAAIPGFGWWALDPTNALVVGERHVVIGVGRDYDDVMPMRGVYTGDARHTLGVQVTMGAGSIHTRKLPTLERLPHEEQ